MKEWICVFLTLLVGLSCANFPLLDVDTNMRIVLVPHDTPVGGIIYRLRASDSDNNFPLTFEVLGALGKSILELNFLGCVETESLCQADVVLKKGLDLGRTYEFQLQVKDSTGDYTKVHAALTATSASAHFNPLFTPRIIHLDESTQELSIVERFEVVKNELNSRPVLLEIRDEGDRIGLKQRLISNNRTEGTLFLKKLLDFETQPWFTFKLLALNGWTNISVDTRNILVSEVIVAVGDVQDAPPIWTLLPSSVELGAGLRVGDEVTRVQASDGDKHNKRLIRYGFLTDGNPFVVFFDLDPMSGVIRLRRNLTELLGIAKPWEPIRMTIIAEEIIPETGRFGRSSIRSSIERTMGNITFWFGSSTSIGPPTFSSNRYVGEIRENSPPGTKIEFGGTGLRVWHQNPLEMLSVSFTPPTPSNFQGGQSEPLSNAFQLLPSQGTGNFSFEIRVANSSTLDYEMRKEIRLMMRGSTSSGLFQEAEILIHIRDLNDNAPIFSQSEYHVDLPEHSPPGTKVIQLQAMDKDSVGSSGIVTYSNLIGSDAFHLDSQTGEITVDKPELLDRELDPGIKSIDREIRLYVEAKDGGHIEFNDDHSSMIRNLATILVHIKLTDKNDNRPEFLQKYYQAVLNPEMTALKVPLFVKAFDLDEGVNSQVKYQSLDSKFFVDSSTGEIRLRGFFQRSPSDGDGPYLGSFKIRAYDLGNPSQSSETIIQLFSEEMVTREIQFVFPSTVDKIRRNQTNIEKMLSSLTGGIVGIQKITPLGVGKGSQRSNIKGEGESTGITEQKKSSNSKDSEGGDELDERRTLREGKKVEGLSSASEKSLVTATVQYPVSATPTRVDLTAFQKAYNLESTDSGVGGKGTVYNPTPPDADMIRLYEAENRALFWILIVFLLILLTLFGIFLCCIYCPCCWLYGHCYSKGGGGLEDRPQHEEDRRRFIKEKKRGGGRKTYPSDETEDSQEREVESSYPNLRREGRRREAWSSENKGGGRWKRDQFKGQISTPHSKGPKGGGNQDVSVEDWEFGPPLPLGQRGTEEIGPRWQAMQQQQQQMQQSGTIAVPALAFHQGQSHPPGQQRRVGYVGQAHPGDEDFNNERRRQGGGTVVMMGDPSEYLIDRSHHQHYQLEERGQDFNGPSRAVSRVKTRQTRFIKTETGEILQFADPEGDDEGKEMLLKRYVEEQGETLRKERRDEKLIEAGNERTLRRIESEAIEAEGGSSISVDRPRAAVVAKRTQGQQGTQRNVNEIDEADKERTKENKSKVMKKTKEIKARQRSHSLSEESESKQQNNNNNKSKSRRSKSQSKSTSKSPPPSKSDSNPVVPISSGDEDSSPTKETKKKRHHHHHHHHHHNRDQQKKEPTTKPTTNTTNTKGKTSSNRKTSKSKSETSLVEQGVAMGGAVGVVGLGGAVIGLGGEKMLSEVDINVIPPSSAPPTDSSVSPKEDSGRTSQKNIIIQTKKTSIEVGVDASGVGVELGEEVGGGDDEDSGIGIGGGVAAKRNKMCEKKSVFTIAYDEVAQKGLRPETPSNNENEFEVQQIQTS